MVKPKRMGAHSATSKGIDTPPLKLKMKKYRFTLGKPFGNALKCVRQFVASGTKVAGIPATMSCNPNDSIEVPAMELKLVDGVDGDHNIRIRIRSTDVYNLAVRRGTHNDKEWYRAGETVLVPGDRTLAKSERYASLGQWKDVKFGYYALRNAIRGIDTADHPDQMRGHFQNLCLMLCEGSRLNNIGDQAIEYIDNEADLYDIPADWYDLTRNWKNKGKELVKTLEELEVNYIVHDEHQRRWLEEETESIGEIVDNVQPINFNDDRVNKLQQTLALVLGSAIEAGKSDYAAIKAKKAKEEAEGASGSGT